MVKLCASCASCVILLSVTAVASAQPSTNVGVGDKAPPLKIKEWIKGGPVDMAKDTAKKLHLVEFWATWCAPCKASVPLLTELQQKHAKDLVIVGVTDLDEQGNNAKAVKRFVDQQGNKMDYVVAIDDNSATIGAYLGGGAIAIPQAFLVARDGTVIWQGSPLDPALTEVIPKAVSGSYDVSIAKRQREINNKLRQLSMAAEMEQWGVVWDGLVEVLKLDPTNELAMQSLVGLYANQLHNTSTLRSWARSHIDGNKTNVAAMRLLAESLMRPEDVARRAPDLALEAAKAAYDSSSAKEPEAVAVYAQAIYQLGDLDRAITLQQEAARLANETDRKRQQQVLDYYLLCKKLQGNQN